MATYKGKLKQKTANGADILHPETEADAVLYSSDATGFTSVGNVKDALDTIITAGVGVTGVKGNDETDYRTGDVNLTPANIGAVPKDRKVNNKELSDNISLDYSDVGAIPASDKGAASGVATLDSNSKIPVAQIPDVVMGQLVYGGTVTGVGVATLSTNAKTKLGTSSSSITLTNNTTATTGYAANEGIFYIVSSNGTFASLSLNVGDWLIATGSSWKKIDNTDAVTSVNGNIGSVTLNANNLPYASSSDTNTIKSVVDGKQDALDVQTAYSAKGSATKVPQITTNGLGQVTKIEEKAIAFPDITIGSASSSGNAITAIAVDSSNKHKINVTKGTFLTANDISGKANLNGGNSFNGTQNINVDGVNTTTPSAGAGVHVSCTEDSTYYHAKVTPSGYEVYTGAGTLNGGQPYTKYGIGQIKYALGDSVMHALTLPAKTGTLLVDTDVDDAPTQDSDNLVKSGGVYSALYQKAGLNNNTFYGSQYIAASNATNCFQVGHSNGTGSSSRLTYDGVDVASSPQMGNPSTKYQNGKIIYWPSGSAQKEFTFSGATAGKILTDGDIGSSVASHSTVATIANNYATKASPTAGTYSAVAVNSQGIVTSGGQVVEVIANGATPSVVTGGLFFEKAAS